MAFRVTTSGAHVRRSIVRNAVAFFAAYLLVLQTVLAGVAAHQMQARGDLATEVICLNSGSGEPASSDHRQSPFACCGVGCLVGNHALEGPSAPDATLTLPAPEAFEARAEIAPTLGRAPPRAGAGPRAPPVAA